MGLLLGPRSAVLVGQVLEHDRGLVLPDAGTIGGLCGGSRRQPPSYNADLLHGLSVERGPGVVPAAVSLVDHKSNVRVVLLDDVVWMVFFLDGSPSPVEEADEDDDEEEEGDGHTQGDVKDVVRWRAGT